MAREQHPLEGGEVVKDPLRNGVLDLRMIDKGSERLLL